MTDGLLGVITRARSSQIVRVGVSLMMVLIILGGVALAYSAVTTGVSL